MEPLYPSKTMAVDVAVSYAIERLERGGGLPVQAVVQPGDISWVQVLPFHDHVSLRLAPEPTPPKRMTVEVAASYTMEAPERAEGLLGQAVVQPGEISWVQVLPFHDQVSFVGAKQPPAGTQPPKKITVEVAASYAIEASQRPEGLLAQVVVQFAGEASTWVHGPVPLLPPPPPPPDVLQSVGKLGGGPKLFVDTSEV